MWRWKLKNNENLRYVYSTSELNAAAFLWPIYLSYVKQLTRVVVQMEENCSKSVEIDF